MNPKTSVLAFDPGLRELGFCHFLGTELVDFGVKSLRRPSRRPKDVLAESVTRLVMDKNPEVVAIGMPSCSQNQQDPAAMLAIQSIKAVVGKHGATVLEFAPHTIKKSATGDERATKRRITEAMSTQFPELSFYKASNRRSRARYFQNMIDAVAVGLTYLKLAGQQRHNDAITN